MQKFRTFGNKVEATHINGVDDVLASVNEAYKNTAAKIIMEYGDKIAPVYESYGKLTVDIEEDNWEEVHAEHSGYERGFWLECKTDLTNKVMDIVRREG